MEGNRSKVMDDAAGSKAQWRILMSNASTPSGSPVPRVDAIQPGQAASDRWSGWLTYVLAVAVTVAALFVHHLALAFTTDNQPAPIVLLIPIILSAYLGGLGPGLISTVLAALGISYFLLPPAYTFYSARPVDYVRLATLIVAGMLISVLNEALHRSRQRAEATLTERQQAEAALREREREYVAIFEQSAVGKAQADPSTGRFLRVNQTFADMTGYSQAELCQMTFVDLTHPDDRQRDVESFEPVRSGRADRWQIEKRYLRKDGSVIWVNVSSDIIRYDKGRPARTIAVIEDITGRKRAEQLLQIKEAELSEAQRLAHIGSWHWDAKTDVTTGSDELLRIYGFDPATQAMLNFKEQRGRCYPVEDWERVNAAVQRTVETGVGYELDVRAIRNDTMIWITTRSKAVRDAEGRIVGLRGTVQDITERKRAEVALRESEQRLSRAQEIAHLGSWELDLVNNVLTWSDEVYRIFGLRPQAFGATYEAFLERVHPDDRPAVDAAYTGSLRENRDTYDIEHRVVRQDTAEIRIVHEKCEHFRDATGRIIRSVGMVHDITERKQAEEKLRLSEERLASILGSLLDGIITVDEQQRITLLNPAVERLFGCRAADLLGQPLDRLIPERFRAAHTAHIRAFGQSNVTRRKMGERIAVYGRRADGEEFPIEAAISQTEVAGQKLFTVILRDITERKRAEAALTQRTEELARSNQDLEQFAYVASHDLQEPLRAVAGCVQLLQKRYQGKIDERADEFIAHAVEGAQRMRQLIDDLLAFSRVGTRGGPLQPVDSGATLAAALANLTVAIHESGAVITHDPLPTVTADPTQLTLLLQNLISNAIKFRREGSPRIHVGAQHQDNHWVLSVRDNGIGIEPQYFERIFGIFQRLHTRREYAGTGIGLAICKKIVERHGGCIWVESVLGAGCTFYCSLPDGQ
jgi:PAS domain S-box-containing protein